jgi:hypothetical protein
VLIRLLLVDNLASRELTQPTLHLVPSINLAEVTCVLFVELYRDTDPVGCSPELPRSSLGLCGLPTASGPQNHAPVVGRTACRKLALRLTLPFGSADSVVVLLLPVSPPLSCWQPVGSRTGQRDQVSLPFPFGSRPKRYSPHRSPPLKPEARRLRLRSAG